MQLLNDVEFKFVDIWRVTLGNSHLYDLPSGNGVNIINKWNEDIFHVELIIVIKSVIYTKYIALPFSYA